jgi:hypothetical protein
MKFYWDLDGPLRDLLKQINHNPADYHEKVNELTVVEYVTAHKKMLVEAPVSEYFTLVEGKAITVITCQPLDWIPYTKEWLRNNLPKAKTLFCQHPLEKMKYLREGCLIIEDYPFFPDNSRVIMVDKPYNQEAAGCYARVHGPAELAEILRKKGV